MLHPGVWVDRKKGLRKEELDLNLGIESQEGEKTQHTCTASAFRIPDSIKISSTATRINLVLHLFYGRVSSAASYYSVDQEQCDRLDTLWSQNEWACGCIESCDV